MHLIERDKFMINQTKHITDTPATHSGSVVVITENSSQDRISEQDHERKPKRRPKANRRQMRRIHMYGDMDISIARNAIKNGRSVDIQCSHFHKESFETLEEAQEIAHIRNEQVALRFTPLEPYLCRYGQHYHVGHMSESKARHMGLIPNISSDDNAMLVR